MLERHQKLHERILYPITRVRSGQVGGSGILIYSLEDIKTPGHYINIVLTCEHVIDSSIKVQKEWDTVLKRDVKRDYFEEVTVELFDYDGSKLVSSNSTQGQIIAYDKRHDLAAIKLLNYRKQPYVASIVPRNEIDEVLCLDPVWVCGCSLLHDPFANPGTLTYLREIIEQKTYLMANASSIFGNSGGGLFHGISHHLLGLTSRIAAIQLGFGIDIMTWMGFSSHPSRLYEFFDDQELKFLYDPKDNFHDAMERRKMRQKEALKALFFSGTGEVPEGAEEEKDE